MGTIGSLSSSPHIVANYTTKRICAQGRSKCQQEKPSYLEGREVITFSSYMKAEMSCSSKIGHAMKSRRWRNRASFFRHGFNMLSLRIGTFQTHHSPYASAIIPFRIRTGHHDITRKFTFLSYGFKLQLVDPIIRLAGALSDHHITRA
jgi:hypothetical protein